MVFNIKAGIGPAARQRISISDPIGSGVPIELPWENCPGQRFSRFIAEVPPFFCCAKQHLIKTRMPIISQAKCARTPAHLLYQAVFSVSSWPGSTGNRACIFALPIRRPSALCDRPSRDSETTWKSKHRFLLFSMHFMLACCSRPASPGGHAREG